MLLAARRCAPTAHARVPVRRRATLTACTRISRARTTTSAVRLMPRNCNSTLLACSLLLVCATDDLQKGLRPRKSVRTAMQHEVAMYAIAQKEGLGFDKAVETCKARMARYQVVPNMLIVPPQARHAHFAFAIRATARRLLISLLPTRSSSSTSPRRRTRRSTSPSRARRARPTSRRASTATRRAPSAAAASSPRRPSRSTTRPTRSRCCSARPRSASSTA